MITVAVLLLPLLGLMLYGLDRVEDWMSHEARGARHAADRRRAHGPATGGRTADRQAADHHTADSDAGDHHTADSQALDHHTADRQALDHHTADGRTADRRTAGRHTAAERRAGDRPLRLVPGTGRLRAGRRPDTRRGRHRHAA
ncbi:hypothetical protein [Streptomyces sp. enrichment culture]|uniref:hypothetical protein n=1 Tax=Streptomyces sp. enrichment culture TaxID=1795815 RepID=UPI003F579227